MSWVITAFTWSFRSNMQFFVCFVIWRVLLALSCMFPIRAHLAVHARDLTGAIFVLMVQSHEPSSRVKNLYIKHWLVVLCLQIMLKVVNHQSFMYRYRGVWTRQDAIELPLEIPLFLRNPNMWKMNKETDSIGTQ